MKTVVVKPEFAGLTEEQVIDAIDAYEAQVDEYYANKGDEEECGCGCSHDEGSCEDSDGDVIPSDDPIVLEVERLIAAYSANCAKKTAKSPKRPSPTNPARPSSRSPSTSSPMPCTTPSWTKTTSKTTEGTSNEVPSFSWGGRLPGGNSPKPFRNRDRLQKIRLRRRPPPKHQDICCLSFRIRLHDASSRAREMVPSSTARTMTA